MIALLLLACTAPISPDTLAVRSCDGMAGLSVDSAGLALLQGLLDPAELELLSTERATGAGFERIGTSGYGVIRANLQCALISADDSGATVLRRTPDIREMDPWITDEVWELPKREQELQLQFIQTPDGLRTHLGLAEFRERAKALHAQGQSGDFEGAIAGWRALEEDLADPMIHFEILALQQQQRRLARDVALSGPKGESSLAAQAGAQHTLILLTGGEECSGCEELTAHLPELIGDRAPIVHLHRGQELPADAWTEPVGWLDPPVLPHLVLLDAELEPTWTWSGYAPQDRADLRAALEDATR